MQKLESSLLAGSSYSTVILTTAFVTTLDDIKCGAAPIVQTKANLTRNPNEVIPYSRFSS